jgi:hypothetical protein
VPVLPIRIKTNIPVLGKSQPWWDVGSSIVVYTIEAGDVLFSDEAPSRAAAIELTKRIGKEIN